VSITRNTVLQNTTFIGALWFASMFWAQVLRKLETQLLSYSIAGSHESGFI